MSALVTSLMNCIGGRLCFRLMIHLLARNFWLEGTAIRYTPTAVVKPCIPRRYVSPASTPTPRMPVHVVSWIDRYAKYLTENLTYTFSLGSWMKQELTWWVVLAVAARPAHISLYCTVPLPQAYTHFTQSTREILRGDEWISSSSEDVRVINALFYAVKSAALETAYKGWSNLVEGRGHKRVDISHADDVQNTRLPTLARVNLMRVKSCQRLLTLKMSAHTSITFSGLPHTCAQ